MFSIKLTTPYSLADTISQPKVSSQLILLVHIVYQSKILTNEKYLTPGSKVLTTQCTLKYLVYTC